MSFPEFPPYLGAPLSPEIVAWSVSAGRYLTDVHKPPTTPRLFGAISVWAGQQVGAGNIVCESTFHSVLNVNLDGTGAPLQPGNNRYGLRAGSPLQFTPEFHRIAEYYRNIADWLVPAARRWCSRRIQLAIERYRYPLAEEWLPLTESSPWGQRVQLGTVVEEALNASRGSGFAAELVHEALQTAELAEVGRFLFQPAGDDKREADRLLIDRDELRRGMLASVFNALMAELPSSPSDVGNVLDKHNGDQLSETVMRAAQDAITTAGEHYREAAQYTMKAVDNWR